MKTLNSLMRNLSPSRLCLVALPFVFCELSVVVFANVIYQYREQGSATVIGTLQVKSPPASTVAGWSTADSSELIALFLDDEFFGLGSGNLLQPGGAAGGSASSLIGMELDGGSLGINYPPAIPSDPSQPIIEKAFSMDFSPIPGEDFFGLATYVTFPNGSQLIEDLFVDGNWIAEGAAVVPEPGTLTLLGVGLFSIAWMDYRKRKGLEPKGCGPQKVHTALTRRVSRANTRGEVRRERQRASNHVACRNAVAISALRR